MKSEDISPANSKLCAVCNFLHPKNKFYGSLCTICHCKTPTYRYHSYKDSARNRDLPFNLELDVFMLYWQQPCYYCDSSIDTIGLDRINNAEGYDSNNIVACCIYCNWMKGTDTQQEFISRCIRITKNHRDANDIS